MKNLFTVLLALLILASCKEKEKPAIPVSKITLEPNPATVAVGGKLKLTSTLTPGEASNKSLTWESSAPTVATVDNNGEVSGLTLGTSTITATATDGSKVTGTTVLTVKSNLSAITLGEEKFNVPIPVDGSTTITLNNAPHTLTSILKEVPVNITVTDGATVKLGTEDFKQGQKVDLTSSKIFTVNAVKYTLAITAYNATSNPYGVYTVAHLNDVRNEKAGSYKLMNDLTLPALTDAGAAAATGITDYGDKGWLPIAHDGLLTQEEDKTPAIASTGGFTGTFDGGNFSVNNLCIKRTGKYAGLFGLTAGATLKNLGVKGSSPVVTTSAYAGALAGLTLRGSAANCYTSVNFSASYGINKDEDDCHIGGITGILFEATLNNCYSTGDISATTADGAKIDAISGGLVGSSFVSKISNCYATGKVSSSSAAAVSLAGGLAGTGSTSTISNCYATGNVSATASGTASSTVSASTNPLSSAGGLVGSTQNKNTISNCYATGSVSATSATSANAGGLAGLSEGGSTMSNCYAAGSVSAAYSSSRIYPASYAGGLVAKTDEGTISNCYRNNDAEIKKNKVKAESDDASIKEITGKSKKEMQVDAFTTSLNKGVSVWGRSTGKNDDLPYITGVGVGKN